MDEIIKLIEALQPLLTLAGGGALTLAGVWYKDRRDRHRGAQEWFRTKYIDGGVEPLHLHLVWVRRYFQSAKAVHQFENLDKARDEQLRENLRQAHEKVFDMFSRRDPLFFPEAQLTRISLLVGEDAVRTGFLLLAAQMGKDSLEMDDIEECLDISDRLLQVMSELHGILQRQQITKRSDIEKIADCREIEALVKRLESMIESPSLPSGERSKFEVEQFGAREREELTEPLKRSDE